MVFKRRDRRTWWRTVLDFFWPRGGWTRAFAYVVHRLRRLPDPPHRIARGIFAGIFVSFTPLFGFHFLAAAGLSWVLRGNVVASLLATFVGNPLTFVPIATSSLQTGYFLLGRNTDGGAELHRSLGGKFMDAGEDLRHNVTAIFTGDTADWSHLLLFYDQVFLPYLVGAIMPGTVAALLGYYFSLPIIQAYQNRRRGALKAKWEALKEKAAAKADASKNHD